MNALNEEFSYDCKEAFEELRDNPEVKSMVFISGKPDCFIAGADINMLAACETKEEIMTLSKGKPTIFLIGSCFVTNRKHVSTLKFGWPSKQL